MARLTCGRGRAPADALGFIVGYPRAVDKFRDLGTVEARRRSAPCARKAGTLRPETA